MLFEDYAEEDFKNPREMLVHVDIMSELLARFIERAIALKDLVEDFGCFITDRSEPLTDREIDEHRDKLAAMRGRYRDLF